MKTAITTVVPSAFSSSVIQEERYQAMYNIWALRNTSDNFHLLASLGLRDEDHVHVVKFGTTQRDGPRILSVVVTVLKNGEEGKWRLHWKDELEFEGELWRCQLHAKKDGNKSIGAKVRGRFNSSTGQGKLYVLAHEQPKPAAEVLTWDQMADTASAHGNIVEVKDQKSITMPLQRGRLVEVLVSTYPGEDNHIHLTCPCMYYPQDGKWVGYVGARFSITANEKSTSLPLALANGCILFTTGSADFIIYPLGFDVDCP